MIKVQNRTPVGCVWAFWRLVEQLERCSTQDLSAAGDSEKCLCATNCLFDENVLALAAGYRSTFFDFGAHGDVRIPGRVFGADLAVGLQTWRVPDSRNPLGTCDLVQKSQKV